MIDPAAARAFLEALTGSASARVTFQTFDDRKPGGSTRSTLSRILHGTLEQHVETLANLNARGVGIFVTVNETDLRGRKAANIVGLRALFADFDQGAPEKYALDPSFETLSRGGPHAYWSLVHGEPLALFGPAQRQIAAHYGSDGTVHDRPRVMRLPGFLHYKGEPFLVEFRPGSGERFTLAEVLAAHPAAVRLVLQAADREPEALTPGERHDYLSKRAASLWNLGYDAHEIRADLLEKRARIKRGDRDLSTDEVERIVAWATRLPRLPRPGSAAAESREVRRLRAIEVGEPRHLHLGWGECTLRIFFEDVDGEVGAVPLYYALPCFCLRGERVMHEPCPKWKVGERRSFARRDVRLVLEAFGMKPDSLPPERVLLELLPRVVWLAEIVPYGKHGLRRVGSLIKAIGVENLQAGRAGNSLSERDTETPLAEPNTAISTSENPQAGRAGNSLSSSSGPCAKFPDSEVGSPTVPGPASAPPPACGRFMRPANRSRIEKGPAR